MHTLFVPSPTFFQLWGPLTPDRGQISARSHHRWIGGGVGYKFSPCKFLYGHSKGVSSNGEIFVGFSQKRQSCLGGWRSAPSAHIVPGTCSLDTQDISLHNSMRTKFRGVPVFQGEHSKYLTEIFRKIWSTLGGWLPDTPADIQI